jgi:hypothetical protein
MDDHDEHRPEFKTPAGPPLRIVFEHTQGPYAGLLGIMGLISDFGLPSDQPLPEYAEGFEAQGRVITFAGLVKVTPRYALYREPFPFGKIQKDFDPNQV